MRVSLNQEIKDIKGILATLVLLGPQIVQDLIFKKFRSELLFF